ncbi:MAG: hypothetical protein QOC98_1828 [Frankiaceae bacterium]|nr:hypothetical protein [Frankiaceae bacterium]
MTSDTSDLRNTRDHPPEDTPRDRVQLSAVQVAASALASVSAAVVASLFGVAGTVVGAGLVAIISTTGSALYSSSMKRTTSQLRRARENLLTARAGESGGTTRPGRTTSSTAVLDRPGPRDRGRPDRDRANGDRADGDVAGSDAGPSRWRRGWLTVGSRRGLKWPALLGAAALVFVLAIVAITAFEALTNKPISSLTGHSGSSSTTIGSLTGSKSTPTPTPTPTSSGSPAGAGTATPTPTSRQSAQPSGAVATPSARASAAAPSPSAAASSAAPAPSSGSGSGSGSSSGSGTGTGGNVTVPVP